MVSRNIPRNIKEILRKEVGFGCPVNGCGSPYLEFHHFDPPYSISNHHNPGGMIALCSEHHKKADYGAYTNEQLHEFKINSNGKPQEVSGKFDWFRRGLLGIVGGNFYFETPILVEFKGKPLVWFEVDNYGNKLLNLNMLSGSGLPRAYMRNNEWFNVGHEEDIICPPSGRLVSISYSNGDNLKVEFFDLGNSEELRDKYNTDALDGVKFPITVVEVTCEVGGTNFKFSPMETKFGGMVLKGCWSAYCRVGLSIG